jgi:hypothetical protein
MAILRMMQPAFTAGELSPALYARVDQAKYQSGLKIAKNVFVHAFGGVSNRTGLEFIGRTKGSGLAVLIPFVYDIETNQTYNLEFSNQRMRVYRFGIPVLEAPKPITGISTGSSGLFTVAGHGFADGDEVVLADIVGQTALNGRSLIVRNVGTNAFNLEDLFGNTISTAALPVYESGGTVRRVYEVATPYLASQLRELVFAQENDVMYLTHKRHPPQKLSRFADDNWTLETPTFAPKVSSPTGLGGSSFYKLQTGDTANINYRVSSLSASGAESEAASSVTVKVQHENEDGRRIRLTWNAVPGAASYRVYREGDDSGILTETPNNEVELTQTQFTGDGSPIPAVAAPGAPATPTGFAGVVVFGIEMSYKVAAISDDSGEESLPSPAFTLRNDMSFQGNKNILNWSAVAGAGSYVLYRLDNGRYGYIGTSETLTFTDENITPDLASGPQEGNNPFSGAGRYPRCVTFYEQRLAMGGTINVPSGVWLGQSANYENFGSSTTVKAADAITFRIRSREKNEVRALLETRGLGVFSSAAEFTVSGGSEDFLTPANVNVRKQGNRGSSYVQPIAIGEVMLFAQVRGGVVRDFSYAFANDAFTGRDLTVLASHLFKKRKVVSWAYAQAPNSIVWVALDDGTLLSLTYMREQEVWAWTRHETDGKVEAVNVVPEDDEDKVYVVVRRAVNGSVQRYIERLHDRLFESSEECFFVDSGLTYDGDPVKTVRGLYHLEGKQVVALADGNVVRGLIVENGAVTLQHSASLIHVGLPYEAELMTLDLDLGMVQGLGSTQGRPKSVASLTMRVEDTRGIWAGPSAAKLTELKQRQFEKWDEATRLGTSDVEITLSSEWTPGGTIVVKQFDPLPMTILAILPEVRVGA